jgi:cell wall-associated NlpC family hydrolase
MLAAMGKAFAEIYSAGEFGYVWGAQGQFITEDELLRLERKYGSRGSGSEGYYHQARTRQWIGKRAADCSGLIMYIYELNGLYQSDKNADMIMAESRILYDAPVAGDLAFRLEGSRAVHVGIYLGESQTLHCRGTSYGLTVTTDIEYRWDRYGRMDNTPFLKPSAAAAIVHAQLY